MPSHTEASEMPIPFGIDAVTGEPLDGIHTATFEDLARTGRDQSVSKECLTAKADSGEAHFGVLGDVDPGDLAQSGWAVMFSPVADRSIREALQPLLNRRNAQVGSRDLFKIFDGASGYQPGDSASAWLARQNVRLDVVDPTLGVPYYIMLVAPPGTSHSNSNTRWICIGRSEDYGFNSLKIRGEAYLSR